ncbi:hypothetical protein L518_1992 [Bordetella bronchiseptica MBORD675]|nr:hypothetical protein L518_1992 [Bordetella bronchiseptica MBORD675]KDD63982.1 hypothetical protein L533_2461 [Bordetella bronchiseptica OSU553]
MQFGLRAHKSDLESTHMRKPIMVYRNSKTITQGDPFV